MSRDNKLKQVFRNTFNWYFEQKKPTPRSEKPWWRPDSIEDGWFGQDPIQDPRTKYDFEKQFNFRYVQPIFNLPITDMFAVPLQRQQNKCADLELKALECVEYYGASRGSMICQDYYDDWHECSHHTLSKLRVRAMQMQRNKRYYEYVRGEREYNTVYRPLPAPHSLHEPLRTFKNDFTDHFQ